MLKGDGERDNGGADEGWWLAALATAAKGERHAAVNADEARTYVSSVRWQFAKTMAHIPHWYTLAKWRPDLEETFDDFVDLIWNEGVVKPWPPPPARAKYHHHYLELDGWEYWVMTEGPSDRSTLINRARLQPSDRVEPDARDDPLPGTRRSTVDPVEEDPMGVSRPSYAPGLVVRIKGTGETGAVLRVFGSDQAEVLVGSTRHVVHVDDLEVVPDDPLSQLVGGAARGKARPYGLRLQAAYLRHAYRYDPRSGLSNARIEPQLHQLSVAHRVVEKLRPRLILADEVGLGKTIEAGLILKELRARSLVDRVLIVTPASLQNQWQSELRSKFNEPFERIDGPTARLLAQNGQNPWLQRKNVICSLNIAVRWADSIREAGWDLVIFDEAHRVRRSKQHGDLSTTQAYDLADQLKNDVFGLLLLTATPMQLSPFELYSLIELVEPGLYESESAYELQRRRLPELNDLMKALDRWPSLSLAERRAISAQHAGVLRNLGVDPVTATDRLESEADLKLISKRLIAQHPLAEVLTRNRKGEVGGFKKRTARRELVPLTDSERAAYERVSDYLRNRYRRTESRAIGFLMVTYQKMLASSSYALKQSLLRRLDKLRNAVEEQRMDADPEVDDFGADSQDLSDDEFDRVIRLAEGMSAGNIEREIDDIVALLPTIDAIKDTKLDRLGEVLEEIARAGSEKVLVFTQFTDTQTLIAERLHEMGITVTTFNGGMDLLAKEESVRRFRGPAQVMVSTEAGGEGRNFQFAHHLVNYDLPWNPMKVEQRIGRLDRIGQTHDVEILNLACEGTIEERVLEVLQERIRLFEESVGALDPILGNFESEFTAAAMAATDDAASEFDRLQDELEGRVRRARQQERIFADLLLDRASLRRDEANRLLETPPLATHTDLRAFVRDALEYAGGNLTDHREGGSVITLSPRLAADLGVRETSVRGTFDPAEGLRLEELPFFTIDHDLVGRIIDLMLSDDFPTIGAREISGQPRGTQLEVYYEVTVQGFRPHGRYVRHLIGEDLEVHAEDVGAVPAMGSSAALELPGWVAAAADKSRSHMLTLHATERRNAKTAEETAKERERVREGRIFDHQARRLRKLIDDDDALADRFEVGTEGERRIVPAIRGRAAKNRERLERLEREHANHLAQIDRRQAQVSFAPVAAALVTAR